MFDPTFFLTPVVLPRLFRELLFQLFWNLELLFQHFWNLELLFQHFVEPWTFVSTVASAFISTVANFKIWYFNVFWCKRVSVLAGFFCKNWEPLCPDELLWKPGAHLLPCRQTWMLNLHQVQEDHLKGNRHARWRPEGVPRLKLAVPNVTFWIHKKL